MKKKILLLHGALGSTSQFEELAKLLSKTFSVFQYDFPGHHGKAFPEERLTVSLLQKHLHEYVREFQLTGCLVFGYSMGGYVALKQESVSHGTFSGIFTLATKFDWSPEIAQKEKAMLNPAKMMEKVPEYADMLMHRHFPGDWKQICEETAYLMEHLGKHAMSADDFDNVHCKVRLAVGDRDMMVTLAETQRIYTELPDASLLVMPHTSHPIEKVNQAYLTEEICRFAAEL
jgi:esterase/lipase